MGARPSNASSNELQLATRIPNRDPSIGPKMEEYKMQGLQPSCSQASLECLLHGCFAEVLLKFASMCEYEYTLGVHVLPHERHDTAQRNTAQHNTTQHSTTQQTHTHTHTFTSANCIHLFTSGRRLRDRGRPYAPCNASRHSTS